MMHTKYAKIIQQVDKPSRYSGEEFGLPARLTQSAAQDSALRIALGFPDVYEVGMSHLGFRLLHAALASRPELQTERIFIPWPDLQQRLAEENLPLLTLESRSPLPDFDLLALSVQYELSWPAVLKLLDLGKLPRRSEERQQVALKEKRNFPLVLVGGTAALNPEPLAPFVDCFFIGEADRAIHQIVEVMMAQREKSAAEKLAALAALPGIYVPQFVEAVYEESAAGPGLGVRYFANHTAQKLPVERQFIENLDELAGPPLDLVPSTNIVHDRIAVEIQRGCCQGCRFCQAGFVTRPTRQRSAEATRSIARTQLARTGYEELALLSLSAGDHPCLSQMLIELMTEFAAKKISISLPSLRTESLHPVLAEQISRVRKTSFTLAPEAATDRLRAVINKNNTEQDLVCAVTSVIRLGYQQIKLYFMIGLPTETDEDVVAIAELSRRLLTEAQQISRRVQITVSVSTFVPKAHTPFQWAAAPTLEEIEHKHRLLQANIHPKLRLKWHDAYQSQVEALLTRGDRRLAVVLEEVAKEPYWGLDAWSEHFSWTRWQQAFAQAQAAGQIPSTPLLLGAREPSLPLPWEHLDVGVTRKYLEAQRRASLQGALRADCREEGRCDFCGVCEDQPRHQLALANKEYLSVSEKILDDEAANSPSPLPPPRSRIRLWMHKQGRGRLLTHLELLGVFERALRRANLPLAFSEGFHPKPRVSFSPALPLGAASNCEFVEIIFAQLLSAAEAVALLKPQLPAGLVIERGEEFSQSLHSQLTGVVWRGVFATPRRELLEQVANRLAAGTEPMIFERDKSKRIDLRQMILAWQIEDDQTFSIHCRFSAAGTIKPSEILRELLGLDPAAAQEVDLTRQRWLLEENKN